MDHARREMTPKQELFDMFPCTYKETSEALAVQYDEQKAQVLFYVRFLKSGIYKLIISDNADGFRSGFELCLSVLAALKEY